MYYFQIWKQLFLCICKDDWNDLGPEAPVPLTSLCQKNKPAANISGTAHCPVHPGWVAG